MEFNNTESSELAVNAGKANFLYFSLGIIFDLVEFNVFKIKINLFMLFTFTSSCAYSIPAQGQRFEKILFSQATIKCHAE